MVAPGMAATHSTMLARSCTCTCKGSTSKRLIGSKEHMSIQRNMAEDNKVTGRFNGYFETDAICGAICRVGGSDDSTLQLAKALSIISSSF